MAMADNPISRRNFLYGMVGTGAALTLGRRVVGSGRVEPGVRGAASASPSGTMTFMSWDSAEVMTPAIKAFEARYPQVSVQPSYVPPVTQYISTLEERLLAGTAPDVFIYTDEDEAELNSHHLVRDLSDQPWVKYLATANREFRVNPGGPMGAVGHVLDGRPHLQCGPPSQSRLQPTAGDVGRLPKVVRHPPGHEGIPRVRRCCTAAGCPPDRPHRRLLQEELWEEHRLGALDRQDLVRGCLDGALDGVLRALHAGARVHRLSRPDG